VKKAKGKVEAAKLVGKAMGEEIKKRKIERVVFDRNGYLYHGRVKAVADGAREAGVKI
jgi:large subunit ribosomal protein L18